MKNILYLLYLILSLFFLPLIIIIDIFFNIKRKDFFLFFYKRYVDPFFIKKNKTNKKYVFIIATSAGEINTIIEHLPALFNNFNILIFTTSITGYHNLIKYKNKNKNFSFQFTYLFPENIMYSLFYYLKFKPVLTLFVESEIWPSILIISKYTKGKNVLVQAQLNQKQFKTYKNFKYIFSFLYSLFNTIFVIDNISSSYFYSIIYDKIYITKINNLNSYKNKLNNIKLNLDKIKLKPVKDLNKENNSKLINFKRFKIHKILNMNIIEYKMFQTRIIISGNLKLNKKYPLPTKPIKKIKSIIFASTHKEEEKYFIKTIINITKSQGNLFIFIVPRHIERSKNVYNQINSQIKNNNIKNTKIYFFSQIEKLENYFNTIFTNNHFSSDIFDRIFKKNISIKKEAKLNKNNNLNENINSNKNINLNYIFIVDKFGILLNLYTISYITIIGATFFNHGGGHNILEPLYYNNYVIAGPYLRNLKEIFVKGAEKKLCFSIDWGKTSNYSKKITKTINQILKNYKKTFYSKPEYIHKISKNEDPLKIISSNIKDILTN